MCGISAIFSSLAHFSGLLIEGMGDTVRHRGPDDEGFYLQPGGGMPAEIFGGKDTPPNVFHAPWPYCPKGKITQTVSQGYVAALGHRRLSILDLSPAGHQPMCTPDKRLWITYNGEIYNFLEVRQELAAQGCRFHTQTDTEVILQAYATWGAGCLSRFNGMFAFVIYDSERRSIFAARDRFGVKPLYYWRSPQGLLCFASEIKQFTTLPGWEARLNGQKAYDFLNWALIDHTQETLFRKVLQLRGGEYLEIPLGGPANALITPVRWYELQPQPFHGSLKNASERFKELLEDSIRLRLRADVSVGSCLSGGLDSSSIVCLAHGLLKEAGQQKTFSACSRHKRFDERAHIEEVVRQTGVDAHFVYPEIGQLLEDLSCVLWHQDEPFPTTSVYAQWLVFKLAKGNNVKVMLDGQGADEQLGGYQGFFGNRIYDMFKRLQWAGMAQEMRSVKQRHPHITPWPLLLNKLVPTPIQQPLRRWLGKSATGPDWLDLKLLDAADRQPYGGGRGLRAQSHQQLSHTSLPMLLHFEDRDSMAHSVESRTPFLDYRLVEFNLGLPGEYKIAQGWTKRVMREGLQEILPPTICWRADKMGFVTAEEEWVCNERPEEFSRLVEESLENAQGIFNGKAKATALRMIGKSVPYSSQVWRQIAFAQWLKLFRCSL